jgi:hypothetical protein
MTMQGCGSESINKNADAVRRVKAWENRRYLLYRPFLQKASTGSVLYADITANVQPGGVEHLPQPGEKLIPAESTVKLMLSFSC